MAKRKTLSKRFWEKVNRGKSDECWLWEASVNSGERGGYGMIGVDGKVRRAHRVAWELAFGPIPEGLCVCHKCDTPGCVNPNHLFLGAHADNMRDKVCKDRQARGVKQPSHKLTPEQVREIRKRYARGGATQQALADEFGVRGETIGKIIRRDTWTHIE